MNKKKPVLVGQTIVNRPASLISDNGYLNKHQCRKKKIIEEKKPKLLMYHSGHIMNGKKPD